MSSQTSSVGKGFLAGALGNLVLNLFQAATLKGTSLAEQKLSGSRKYTRQQKELLKTFEKAHVETARHLAGAVGTSISWRKRKQAAPAVEYAFGILCAGVYGALAEYVPAVTGGFGATYGATLFFAASEVVLPEIGFVPSPQARTPVQHLGGLAGNIVYGATTEATRYLIRSAL